MWGYMSVIAILRQLKKSARFPEGPTIQSVISSQVTLQGALNHCRLPARSDKIEW